MKKLIVPASLLLTLSLVATSGHSATAVLDNGRQLQILDAAEKLGRVALTLSGGGVLDLPRERVLRVVADEQGAAHAHLNTALPRPPKAPAIAAPLRH